MVLLLQDSEPILRASSISVLTSVLSLVTTFPPSDAMIFPRYIFKKVAHLLTDPSIIVRVAFADNIALLAETALRFLDVGHAVSLCEAVAGRHARDGSGRDDTTTAIFSEEAAGLLNKPDASSDAYVTSADRDILDTVLVKSSYDSDLATLREVVFRWVVHVATDTSDHSSQSKQALLRGLPRIVYFFGAEYMFQILPLILAFLNNHKDSQLRASLCRHLPSVCAAVGRAATEQFVIPCIQVTDCSVAVIIEALSCLSALISMSLLTRTSLLGTEIAGSAPAPDEHTSRPRRKKQGVIRKCGPLLLHPSCAVRQAACRLVLTSRKLLGDTDMEVFVNELLRPYLQYRPSFESLADLLACLKAPELPLSEESTPENSIQEMKSIDAEIGVSIKLARNLSVPSQKSIELLSRNSVNWFEPLHIASSKDPTLCDASLALGFAGFRKGMETPLYLHQYSSHVIMKVIISLHYPCFSSVWPQY